MRGAGTTHPVNFLSLRWIVRLISTLKSYYFTEDGVDNTAFSGLWI